MIHTHTHIKTSCVDNHFRHIYNLLLHVEAEISRLLQC